MLIEQDRININDYHYNNYKNILKALNNNDEAEIKAICFREMNIIDQDMYIENDNELIKTEVKKHKMNDKLLLFNFSIPKYITIKLPTVKKTLLNKFSIFIFFNNWILFSLHKLYFFIKILLIYFCKEKFLIVSNEIKLSTKKLFTIETSL